MTLTADLAQVNADATKFRSIVNGAYGAFTTTDSGSCPSLATVLANIGSGNARGAWVTATAYSLNDVVTNGGSTYRCVAVHTSGTFATDLAAGRWIDQTGGLLGAPNSWTGINTFANATDSTSTGTGALVTTGGLGVAKNISVGAKVGIGTNPSTYQVDVLTSGNNGLRISNGTNQNYLGTTGGTACVGTLTAHSFAVISGGTIAVSIDTSQNIGVGVTPTAGNGLLQLASGTTKANGIAFGTDNFLHRGGSGNMYLTGGVGAAQSLYVQSNGGGAVYLYADSAQALIGTPGATTLRIQTNSTTAIAIDSAQAVSLAGILSTVGSATIGDTSSVHSLNIRGSTSGAGGGAYLTFTTNGFYLGGKSAIIGGGYDSTAMLYTNNTVPLEVWTSGAKALTIDTSQRAIHASGVGFFGVTPPAQATGFGTPTGASRLINFPGASATLAQCSGAIADLITYLKSTGLLGA